MEGGEEVGNTKPLIIIKKPVHSGDQRWLLDDLCILERFTGLFC